jgi:hypothetical protein
VRKKPTESQEQRKIYLWSSWDIGEETITIKSNRKSVGFPSFPCF